MEGIPPWSVYVSNGIEIWSEGGTRIRTGIWHLPMGEFDGGIARWSMAETTPRLWNL